MRDTSRSFDGLRFLDPTAEVGGPLACQVPADLGAEVIEIEPSHDGPGRRVEVLATPARYPACAAEDISHVPTLGEHEAELPGDHTVPEGTTS